MPLNKLRVFKVVKCNLTFLAAVKQLRNRDVSPSVSPFVLNRFCNCWKLVRCLVLQSFESILVLAGIFAVSAARPTADAAPV